MILAIERALNIPWWLLLLCVLFFWRRHVVAKQRQRRQRGGHPMTKVPTHAIKRGDVIFLDQARKKVVHE